jgi:beta-carotene hydroxylase
VTVTAVRPDAPPALAGLGVDLSRPSFARRALCLGRPFGYAAAFALLASRGWVLLAVPLMFPLFVSAVAALNDTLHGSFRLSPWADDLAMSALGLLVFESGHSIRATQRFHHEVPPGAWDPEGYVDALSWPALLAEAFRYRYRLWLWTWRTGRASRRWLAAEYVLHVALVAGGLAAGGGARLYVLLALAGGYTFPVFSARGPHTAWGTSDPLRTVVRGRLVPRLLLGLTYHLEHHLYPDVPSFRLPALVRRLEPWLAGRDLRRVRLW